MEHSLKVELTIITWIKMSSVVVLICCLSSLSAAASNKDYLNTQTTKLLFELSNQRFLNVVEISDQILLKLADDTDNNYSEIYFYKATALSRLGQYSAAKSSFEMAKLQGVQALNWFYEMAIVEFRLKDFEQAKHYIFHYLEHQTADAKQHSSALYYSSLIAFSGKHYSLAITQLEQFFEVNQSLKLSNALNSNARYLYSAALFHTEKLEAAETALTAMLANKEHEDYWSDAEYLLSLVAQKKAQNRLYYFSLKSGLVYDSNVNLGASGEELVDYRTEVDVTLGLRPLPATALEYQFFTSLHQAQTNYNLLTHAFSVLGERTLSQHYVAAHYEFNISQLAQASYLQAHKVNLSWAHKFSVGKLSVSLPFEYRDFAEPYKGRTGTVINPTVSYFPETMNTHQLSSHILMGYKRAWLETASEDYYAAQIGLGGRYHSHGFVVNAQSMLQLKQIDVAIELKVNTKLAFKYSVQSGWASGSFMEAQYGYYLAYLVNEAALGNQGDYQRHLMSLQLGWAL